jgi:predicted nucleic acid-binding protein
VAILFLDTSALVKLYVHEMGTERMLGLAHPDAENQLAIISLTRVEFRAAVRLRAKLGDIDAEAANNLVRDFGEHLANLYQVQPVNEMVIEEASGLIDRHALRAYDAVQLGACLALRATVGDEFETHFVCADDVLLEAARGEGVAVINPAAG